jgi:hypothetical protein
MFTLFVKESGTQAYLDTLVLESISEEAFDLESYVVEPGTSYEVDFYSDHNGNGVYDAPPTDHAWRLETGVISGDMDLDFQHSTEFTDIFATTGIGDTHTGMAFLVYPNPATNLLQIESEQHIGSVALYDLRGAKVKEIPGAQQLSLSFSLEDIPSGMYFVEVRSSSGNKAVSQLIKR